MAPVASSPFGDLLKRSREAAGLTQDELADRAGVSARAISDLERGVKKRPHADTVQRLVRALDLAAEEQDLFHSSARGASMSSLPGEGQNATRASGGQETRPGPPDGTIPTAPTGNIPVQLTSFVGRPEELRRIEEMVRLENIRLITLTGPGGSGKTRLALEVGGLVPDAFPDGIYFVSLASIDDPALVASAIAGALGLVEQGGQTLAATIRDHLREKRLLLILDNFEHLLPAASLIGDLLSACPGLKVLATSRAILHMSAEHVHAVPPLTLPDLTSLPDAAALARYDAIALFLTRARAARADFMLTDENAPVVAEICCRLDGLPLAIELAAARIRLFPPQALLARLSNRLGVLTAGARDLPARQQTLQRTMEWSYSLLNPGEQRLLRRLAIFVGGCSLEAAEDVCAPDRDLDTVEGVGRLVDQSLLCPVDHTSEESRLVMLETIREYALQRMMESGEGEALHRRHAEYYLALAEEAEPELVGAGQTTWLPRLEREHHNLRAALRWCVLTADGARGLRLAGALWRFWYVHSHFTEGRRWLDQLLALPSAAAPTPARAKALNGAGNLAYSQGDYKAAEAWHNQSLTLRRQLDDRPGIATSLNNLALVARERGDHEVASRLLEEAIALSRELGHQRVEALALGNLGNVRQRQGAIEAAGVLHAQALGLFTGCGDEWGRAMALGDLAAVAHAQGDTARARAYFEESCALRRDVGDRRGLAVSLAGLSAVLLEMGDVGRARVLLAESLGLRETVRDSAGLLDVLEGVAALAAATGRSEEAAQLSGAVTELRTPLGLVGMRAARGDPTWSVGLSTQDLPTLDEASFASAWAEGESMSLAQALRVAHRILRSDC